MAEQGIKREISAYKLRILHEEYCPVGQHFSWGLFEWAAQNFICLAARYRLSVSQSVDACKSKSSLVPLTEQTRLGHSRVNQSQKASLFSYFLPPACNIREFRVLASSIVA